MCSKQAPGRRFYFRWRSLLISYFDPSEPASFLTGNLPHWRQKGKIYFVTFRLADSLPQDKLRLWRSEQKSWLESHSEPHKESDRAEYFRLFTERIQNWLDAGFGCCVLARPKAKAIVEASLAYFNGTRYVLDEFVVMSNHVHALVTPLGDHGLSDILHTWKSFTAKAMLKNMPEATSLFRAKLRRRDGASILVHQVWQKESFDHIVRSSIQLDRIRQYIRDNPKVLGKQHSLDLNR